MGDNQEAGGAERDRPSGADGHLAILTTALGVAVLLLRLGAQTSSIESSYEIIRRVGIPQAVLGAVVDSGTFLVFPIVAGVLAVRALDAFARDSVAGPVLGLLSVASFGLSMAEPLVLLMFGLFGLGAAALVRWVRRVAVRQRREKTMLLAVLRLGLLMMAGLLGLAIVGEKAQPPLPVEGVRLADGALLTGWVLDDDAGGFIIVMRSSDSAVQRALLSKVTAREVCVDSDFDTRPRLVVEWLFGHRGRTPAYRKCDDPALATP